MAKKITNSIEVDGHVAADAVQRRTGGTSNEVFTTDGGLANLPSVSGGNVDGLKYFKAAYKDGLTFLVTAEWQLGGVLFLMRQAELTLAPADATFDRIDVIAVDDSGNIIIIQGNPAATPVKPTVDPVTQLEGTFVTIPAGSAIPAGTVVTDVYFENLGTGGGEWDGSVTGGTINLGSTTNPVAGSVSIEGTNSVAGHMVIFTPVAPIDLQDTPMKQLNYIIRNKAALNGRGDTHRFVFNGLDAAGNPVSILLPADPTYSLSSTIAQFLSLTTPDYTQIKTLQNIQFEINWKSTFGFFLDSIRLVEVPVTAVVGNWATIEYVVERDNYLEGRDIEDGVITGTTSKNLALNRYNGETINIPFTDETGGAGSGHPNINRVIDAYFADLSVVTAADVAAYLNSLDPPIDNTDGKNLYIRLIEGEAPIDPALSGESFIMEVDTTLTDVDSTNSTAFTLPLPSNGVYNFDVNWGDGNVETITSTSQKVHTYATGGVYNISIRGQIEGFGFGGFFKTHSPDALKVTKILQFGSTICQVANGGSYFTDCFSYCTNLSLSSVTDTPILSSSYTDGVVAFSPRGFLKMTVVTDIPFFTTWDFSNCTDLYEILAFSNFIGGDLSSLNLSNVTSLSRAFMGTPVTGNFSGWNVSSCANFGSAFADCSSLISSDFSNWVFNNAGSYSIAGMFNSATGFEGAGLDTWNTAGCTNMGRIFESIGSTLLLSRVDNWDITDLVNTDGYALRWFMDGLTGATNLDTLYNNWAAQATVINLSQVGLGLATYTSAGQAARDTLVNTLGWEIFDGGLV